MLSSSSSALAQRDALSTPVEVVARHLPPTLVLPDRLERILDVSRLLPPVAVAGFECRLTPGDEQVDFAIHLPSADRTFPVFAGLSESHLLAPELLQDLAWQRIRDLCQSVAHPCGALRGVIDDLWVEFDLPTGAERQPPPALFFSTGAPAAMSPRQYLQVLETVLATLDLGPLTPRLRAGVLHTTEQLPAGSGVFQFGVRVAEPVAAMRLCIFGLPPDQLVSFLRGIGWRHDPGPLQRIVDHLARAADEVLLDVDVGEEIGARVGLEAHLRGPKRPSVDARWVTVLDWLVAEGLCDRQTRRDLRAWGGTSFLSPHQVAALGGLGAASRLVGQRASVSFLRGLHHVKVCHTPDATPEAKAYIGFARQWAASLPPASGTQRPTSGHHPVTRSRDPSAQAIADGLRFLGKARNPAGWWEDFSLASGLSDAWVTAYTGRALTELDDQVAADLAGEAWRLLAGRPRDAGGWGYNASVPPDADTTTWAILLAHEVEGAHSPRLAPARAFLARHRRSDGGLATYTDDAALRAYLSLPDAVSTAGWTGSHPCVSAAAAHVFGFGPHLDGYLLRAQQPDGSWSGYWWADREYATGLAVQALAGRVRPDRDASDAARRRGLTWLRAQLRRHLTGGPDPHSALAQPVAGCLAALSCCDDATETLPLISAAIDWLARTQRPDGSWGPSARLRIPPTDCRRPDDLLTWDIEGHAYGAIAVDQHRVFTTASVLVAISRGQTRLTGSRRLRPGR